MKIIKTYESFNLDELDLGRFSKIIYKPYLKLNEEGTFDYDGNLNFTGMDLHSLDEIPVKLRSVLGSFDITSNKLISLKGCPLYVQSDYFACGNNRLISLQYAPLEVDGNFNCMNNLLLSKEHLSNFTRNFSDLGNAYIISNGVYRVVESMSFEQQMAELDFFEQHDLRAFGMMKEVLDTLGVNYGPETRNMVGVMKGYTNAKNLF